MQRQQLGKRCLGHGLVAVAGLQGAGQAEVVVEQPADGGGIVGVEVAASIAAEDATRHLHPRILVAVDVAEDLLVDAQAGVEHDGGGDGDRQFDLAVDVAEALVVDALEELRGQAEACRLRAPGTRWARLRAGPVLEAGGCCKRARSGAYVVVGGRQGQVVLEFHGERKPGVVIDAGTVAEGGQNTPNVLVEARRLARNGYHDAGQDSAAGSQKGSPDWPASA